MKPVTKPVSNVTPVFLNSLVYGSRSSGFQIQRVSQILITVVRDLVLTKFDDFRVPMVYPTSDSDSNCFPCVLAAFQTVCGRSKPLELMARRPSADQKPLESGAEPACGRPKTTGKKTNHWSQKPLDLTQTPKNHWI